MTPQKRQQLQRAWQQRRLPPPPPALSCLPRLASHLRSRCLPRPHPLPANIPVIGFNAVLMSEHMASFFVFGLLHAALAIEYIRDMLPPRAYSGQGPTHTDTPTHPPPAHPLNLACLCSRSASSVPVPAACVVLMGEV